MGKNVNRAKNPVKSALTTLRIVEALKDREGARVTDLAQDLDLPKSSVHNYLSTLEQEEYVVKCDNRYYVGLKFLDIGTEARNRLSIHDIAKPEMQSLAEQTGELSNLLVEEHGKGVYIHREVGEDAVQVDATTGQRVHLHNTGLGKAILAHLPPERVEEILDRHGMPATTENTITDPENLFDELAEIRDRGVAFDREERLNGLRCVAAPILDQEDEVVGAVSVSGPRSRMSTERFREDIPTLLRNAVNIIELNIAYR
ncbi:IclR family transcriptional regulator [Halopelagius longus]|uniref:IclR family transcriptional regulator n=1 Tax=Halopelagius longus TaxID=1236180 RepID=A0A1H1FC57_9EURY|nr:IclR family transcriptional regulator [Halopelagius longus]RDI70179.1 IclR family transcriptional regulator [Halopelagius longus]SDQ98354.1 transcriptional regulator, IclR family [Halopelagius longus]